MGSELKPCPFCGLNDALTDIDGAGLVKCRRCWVSDPDTGEVGARPWGLRFADDAATARAEAAEQRAEAAEREVTRLREDRTALASMWLMTLPPAPLATVLPSAPDAMRVLGGGLLDVTGEDMDTEGLIVYMRDLLARMLAEAQPAEVSDG